MLSIPKKLCGWLVLLLMGALACSAQCEPKTALKEVVITNYVGNRYAKHDSPEYISRLVLRADGNAFYFGNPTYAPRTGQFRGTFASSQFTRISKMLSAVFSHKQVKVNGSANGDTRTEFDILRADGAQRHLVFYAMQHNPTLNALNSIADGLSWQLKWQRYVGVNRYNRDLSGVRGVVLRGRRGAVRTALGVPSNHVIPGATLSLRKAGKEVARGYSDRAGQFCVLVPPGTYELVPLSSKGIAPDPSSIKQTVMVTANGFSDVVVETATRNSSKN